MREILFRGKPAERFKDIFSFPEVWGDNIQDGFVIGSLVVDGDRCYIAKSGMANCRQLTTNGITTMVEVITETVGQYTGLTDKNGKKVFNGDIIRYADRLAFNCYSESIEAPEEYDGCYYEDIFTTDEVVYGIYYDYPAFDLKNHDFDCNGLSELCNGDWHFEVIGNIHEQGAQ